MNERVTNETPTEIAGDAAVFAEMAALRHRLAALEARLPGNAPEQPPGRQAKRRPSPKTVAWLTTGAVLAMLAGASIVYTQSPVDALSISKEGKVGIGTSTPAAKLHVAGSGWFGPDSGGLDATAGCRGTRVPTGRRWIHLLLRIRGAGPRNLILQQRRHRDSDAESG
jgi:hypothetical protein